jgi:trimeric autotransporter adhesin
MNKRIYRLVWNASLGQVAIASELANCRHAGGSTTCMRGPLQRTAVATALLLACATPAFAQSAPSAAHAQSAAPTIVRATPQTVPRRNMPEAHHKTACADADSAPATAFAASIAPAPDDASTAMSMQMANHPFANASLHPLSIGTDSGVCTGFTGENASGKYATACGINADASGSSSASAFGCNAQAAVSNSTAIGAKANALFKATALDYKANASGNFATAVGIAAVTPGQDTAVGGYAYTSGSESSALGWTARASSNSTAIGAQARATGDDSSVPGLFANAGGCFSTALGSRASASGAVSTAVGRIRHRRRIRPVPATGLTAVQRSGRAYRPDRRDRCRVGGTVVEYLGPRRRQQRGRGLSPRPGPQRQPVGRCGVRGRRAQRVRRSRLQLVRMRAGDGLHGGAAAVPAQQHEATMRLSHSRQETT